MDGFMEDNTCATSWKGVMESDTGGASWKKPSWNASRKLRGVQRQGKALCKSVVVEHHGNSCHGMRNGKYQRSQNVSLSECHGNVVMDGFMECITYGTSWKGVTEINICLASRKKSRKAPWKLQGAQRHSKASWKAILVKRHGKAVMECVMETARCVESVSYTHLTLPTNREV